LGSYSGHTLGYASLTTFYPTVTQKFACDVMSGMSGIPSVVTALSVSWYFT